MPTYLRYTDEVEQTQPHEEETVAEIRRLFAELRLKAFEKHRHAIRDAHAKSHGLLRGELRVYEGLPEELAQGLFAEPKAYPVIVRFSTSPGDLLKDSMPAFRGMAIKVVGVSGEKVIPEDRDAVTQDFTLVNHPTINAGTVDKYLREIKQLALVADQSEGFQKAAAMATRAANAAANVVGQELLGAVGQGKREDGLLDQTFFSMAAIRYGDYVAKVCAAPHSPELLQLDDHRAALDDVVGLRDEVRAFFAKQGAEYEIRAQLCTDLGRMPVEDGGVRWDEEESPYRGVARLVLPPQETYSHARRVYADDVLTFNPWHCVPEHRPLGNIQRVRRPVYDESTRFRHDANQRPLREPASIDELPD